MNFVTHRCAILVALVNVLCIACESNAEDVGASSAPASSTFSDPSEASPLVGTWRWMGETAVTEALEITFNPDGTLTFVDQLAPHSRPAGSVPSLQAPGFDPESCFPTSILHGTYSADFSEDEGRLTWVFAEGTTGRVAGCSDASLERGGVAIPADAVASYIESGWLPPTVLTFQVGSDSLLLASSDTTTVGVARGEGTSFTRTR